MYRGKNGFTIVELLIVIVVIGILAAITIVSFSGMSDRAQDARRKSDLNTITKAVLIYSAEHGNSSLREESGCGAMGQGSGWWHTEESSYPKSTRDCLADSGIAQVKSIIDPTGCTGGGSTVCSPPHHRYMVLACELNGQQVYYVMGRLATEPLSSTATDGLCTSITTAGSFTVSSVSSWDTTYDINYVQKVY